MFQEERKFMAELKVLREKVTEIDRLIQQEYSRSTHVETLVSLALQKNLIESRIKELDSFLYPDVIA
jgi:hypothetical protein